MDKDDKCIFCSSSDCKAMHEPGRGVYKVQCKFCGTYFATEELNDYIKVDNGKVTAKFEGDLKEYDLYIIQSAIVEHNMNGHTPLLTWGDVEDENAMTIHDLLSSVQIPSGPMQKIDKFLENIDKESNSIPGKDLSLPYDVGKNRCYARDSKEFIFILKSMDSEGYFEQFSTPTGSCSFQLSLYAWKRIEELKGASSESLQAFIACSFADDHEIFSGAIEKAITEAGFEPMIIKHRHYPETIMSKALGEIQRSRFIVVDLTKLSDSVFFEAGFALGKNIEIIYVIHESEWDKLKEFYSKNYNIKKYKDEKHLKELIKTAISERIF